MKKIISVLLFVFFLSACNLSASGPAAPATPLPPEPTETPAPPTPTITPTPTFAPLEMTDAFGVPMMFVPAGEFRLGDTLLASDDNQPIHEVYVDAFYMDKYEVSNALYASCVNAGVCAPPGSESLQTLKEYYGNPEYDNYPVVFVSWYQARAYCEWRGARLPTEAEWEKAARGGARIFPWGHAFKGNVVSFCERSCDNPAAWLNHDDGHPYTMPVDSFPDGQSPYGIYNMAGNISEWTSSLFVNYPYNKDDGRENPQSSGDRVIRGGAWDAPSDYALRSANRGWATSIGEYDTVGFRCVRDETP